MKSRLPLEGYRILDMTEVWAGPMGTSYLADLGAEVIRIESFPREGRNVGGGGGQARAQSTAPGMPEPPRAWDRTPTYHMANRNKLGIALNVADPRGKEVFCKLVGISDAFVIGFSSGTADRMGLSYESLVQYKPDLVMLSMPAWGEKGPYQGYVTYGSGPDAWSGNHILRGYPDLDPSATAGTYHLDAAAAVSMGFAITSALHFRDRSGRGQFIDFAMAEVLLNHMPRPAMDWVMNNRVAEPIGNVDPELAPNGCYPCEGTDAWVTIVVRTDEQWRALKRALGSPLWAEDTTFDSVLGRVAARDSLDAHLREWTQTLTPQQVFELLQAVGVPAGPVVNVDGPPSDPHLQARGYYRWVTHPITGQYRRPGPVFNLAATPVQFRRHTNLLGEHNAEVLRGLLGLSEEEYESLVDADIVGDEYGREARADA